MAKRQTVPHFSTFAELMGNLILPHRQAHPDFERLDRLSGVGNRSPFATFNHFNQKWKVAKDTKIDRLLAAWELHQSWEEPFVEASTKGNKPCLRLNEANPDAKGLFIYQ